MVESEAVFLRQQAEHFRSMAENVQGCGTAPALVASLHHIAEDYMVRADQLEGRARPDDRLRLA